MSFSIGCLMRKMTRKIQSINHVCLFLFFHNNIVLPAKAALYLGLSLTDPQRSHLGQRQFSTLISLLELRQLKVKAAYYYHYHHH